MIVITYKHNSTYNLPEVQYYITLNLIAFTFRSGFFDPQQNTFPTEVD
jgi:hypothetical protein